LEAGSPRQVYFSLAGRFILGGYDPRSERPGKEGRRSRTPQPKDNEEQPGYISDRLSVVA
jgi:hypothetical protein